MKKIINFLHRDNQSEINLTIFFVVTDFVLKDLPFNNLT